MIHIYVGKDDPVRGNRRCEDPKVGLVGVCCFIGNFWKLLCQKQDKEGKNAGDQVCREVRAVNRFPCRILC